MPKEIELKLSLTPQAARTLGQHPLLAGHAHQRQRLCNTYYDTATLALTAARVAVRFRYKGEHCLLTVKSAEAAPGGLAERSEWEVEAAHGVFDFSHVDHPALRQQLEALQSQLLPLFTTDFVRDTWQVRGWQVQGQLQVAATGGSRPVHIEVALDRGSIASTGLDGQRRQETLCELELELIEGQPADLFALAATLQPEFNLHPSLASKAERGYRCFLQTPFQPVKASPSAVQADWTPTAALRHGLLEALGQLQRNQAGMVHAEANPEFVHQARVALRRLHSLLKTGEPLLPAGFAGQYFSSFKPLMQRLGKVRNLDVFLHETLPALKTAAPRATDWLRVQQQLQTRRDKQCRALLRQLASVDYGAALLALTAALHGLRDLPDALPLADFAALRLNALQHRIGAQIAALMPEGAISHEAESECHALRLACKRMRYSLAFCQPLWSGEALHAFQQALVAVQEVLGQLNDLSTAPGLLTALKQPVPEAAPFVAGWVAGRKQDLLVQLPKVLARLQAITPVWQALDQIHNP